MRRSEPPPPPESTQRLDRNFTHEFDVSFDKKGLYFKHSLYLYVYQLYKFIQTSIIHSKLCFRLYESPPPPHPKKRELRLQKCQAKSLTKKRGNEVGDEKLLFFFKRACTNLAGGEIRYCCWWRPDSIGWWKPRPSGALPVPSDDFYPRPPCESSPRALGFSE